MKQIINSILFFASLSTFAETLPMKGDTLLPVEKKKLEFMMGKVAEVNVLNERIELKDTTINGLKKRIAFKDTVIYIKDQIIDKRQEQLGSAVELINEQEQQVNTLQTTIKQKDKANSRIKIGFILLMAVEALLFVLI